MRIFAYLIIFFFNINLIFSSELISQKFDQLNLDINTIFNDEIIEFIFFPNNEYLNTAENFNEILKFNKSFFVSNQSFYSLPNNLKLQDYSDMNNIYKISYEISNNSYDSYAYYLESKKNSNYCLLIIPGSGINQSTEIFKKSKDNYHYGILNNFDDYNKYIYIKPNEDFNALVGPNKKKLSYDFITNFHLLNGGSYSTSYLSQIIAFTKHLKEKCSKLVNIGISQGGEAVFIASTFLEADYTLVISGIHEFYKNIVWKSFKQIDTPNLANYLDQKLNSKKKINSNYFFLWGLNENFLYSNEASSLSFCDLYESIMNNSVCLFHIGGHKIPDEIIKDIELIID